MKYWTVLMIAGILLSTQPLSTEAAAVNQEPETVLYGVGSVSKVYTAAAVMKLVQKGQVDLDAPLTDYLPEFSMEDTRYKQITPRMLLNHASGLQGSVYTNSMTLGGSSTENHDLLLERLKSQRLKAEPGSFSVYCNDGFTLAELVVERVSGLGFTEYIKKEFSIPLGIKNLESPRSQFDKNLLADSYYGNKLLPFESANLLGSGGLYSTAEDVCLFFSMFTDSAVNQDNPVLTKESVLEMSKPAYESDIWKEVPAYGSSVAYGLGWDSMVEYPYAGYGIKAWSKGGDTTAYHTAVTVLPEKNLTCAVTASGGSSMAASRAVEKILMEYLEQQGELQAETEMESVAKEAAMPEALKKYEGYYASGKQLMKIEFTGDNKMLLSSIGTQRDTTQTYLYESDGSFRSQNQDYLSLSGSLVAAEGGVYGTTSIRILENKEGVPYLTMETKESQPGFEHSSISVPFAQKVYEHQTDEQTKEAWKAREDKEYLLISEQYNSALYLENPLVKLSVREECPGLLVVNGNSAAASVLNIKNERKAQFFQQIPGHSGRDLYDLTVMEKNGTEYLDSQNYKYMDASRIKQVSELGDRVTVKKRDEAVWYQVGEQTGDLPIIRITAPQNGHFYVYRTTKNGLKFVSGSITGDSGREITLAENGMLMFAGEEGAEFTIAVVPSN